MKDFVAIYCVSFFFFSNSEDNVDRSAFDLLVITIGPLSLKCVLLNRLCSENMSD